MLAIGKYIMTYNIKGEEFFISHRKIGNSNPVMIYGHELTIEDLDAIEVFIGDILSQLRPLCESLDEKAQKEKEDHGREPDYYPDKRLFRQIPEYTRQDGPLEREPYVLPKCIEGAD